MLAAFSILANAFPVSAGFAASSAPLPPNHPAIFPCAAFMLLMILGMADAIPKKEEGAAPFFCVSVCGVEAAATDDGIRVEAVCASFDKAEDAADAADAREVND